jgi:putative sigma-54 modulation protein
MIQLEVKGVHFEVDDKMRKYLDKKIAKLDRFVPRAAREPLHATVILIEEEGKSKNRFTCDVTLAVPHTMGGAVVAKEATVNMYAAVDIVEAKLRSQLLKYKSKLTDRHLHRRIWRRVRRASVE